jgi:acyl-CoA synthetase (AMP-forming)/AMP-acid ligase II
MMTHPVDATIGLAWHQLSAHHAARTPDRIALRFQEDSWTWAELELSTNQLANQLVSVGCTAGARVGYLGKNSVDWVQLIFAAAKAGALLVSVNWRLTPAEISFILSDSAPSVLIVAGDFLAAAAEVDGVDAVPHRFSIGATSPGFEPFEAWRNAGDTRPLSLPVGEETPLCICYTSGTTGRPKGAVLAQRAFMRTTSMIADVVDFQSVRADECLLLFKSPFHTNGPNSLYAALHLGGVGIVLEEFDVAKILSLVGRHPVKTLSLVPTMLKMVLDHPDAAETDFSRLQYLAYGAAPMPTALLRQAIDTMDCQFVQAYGLTENPIATLLLPDDHSVEGNERMRSVGRALPQVELRIVGEDGTDVLPGVTGEIWIRSPAMMVGYWRNPDATARAITSDGWLRTGDAAALDDDGYVFLKDRISDVIISGGENVYPAEVEDALYGHPAVAQVAVVGVPHERWGEVPAAFVVAVPGAAEDAESLLEHASKRLARYKLPTHVVFVDKLPTNPTGKVLRRQLRDRWLATTHEEAR